MNTVLTEETVVSSSATDTHLSMQPGAQTKLRPERPAEKLCRSRNRRWLWLALLAAVVVVGAWIASSQLHVFSGAAVGKRASATDDRQNNGKASLGFQAGDKSNTAATYETVSAEVVNRSELLRLTGTLMADERSSVASNVSGIAAEVRIDRGSVVRKNDVLVQIDPTDAKSKLAEGQAMLDELKARLGLDENLDTFNPEDEPEVRLAKASADLAASNLKRADELFAKKVMSREAYDQTQTEYELAHQKYRQALLLIKQAYQVCKTAQIKLAILEKAVADTTIRAPFDGWVAEKLVAVGEQISSGMQATKVVTLVRIDPLRLSLTVPQQSIGYIKLGQTVRFHVDSFPDRTFEGKVRFIAPTVSHDTRSMLVEAVVPNSDEALCPGLFATAELELQTHKPQVFVTLSAVQEVGDAGRVFVVRDGVAREQIVALGEIDKDKIEIRSGLTGEETLIARPDTVHDGAVVRQ